MTGDVSGIRRWARWVLVGNASVEPSSQHAARVAIADDDCRAVADVLEALPSSKREAFARQCTTLFPWYSGSSEERARAVTIFASLCGDAADMEQYVANAKLWYPGGLCSGLVQTGHGLSTEALWPLDVALREMLVDAARVDGARFPDTYLLALRELGADAAAACVGIMRMVGKCNALDLHVTDLVADIQAPNPAWPQALRLLGKEYPSFLERGRAEPQNDAGCRILAHLARTLRAVAGDAARSVLLQEVERVQPDERYARERAAALDGVTAQYFTLLRDMGDSEAQDDVDAAAADALLKLAPDRRRSATRFLAQLVPARSMTLDELSDSLKNFNELWSTMSLENVIAVARDVCSHSESDWRSRLRVATALLPFSHPQQQMSVCRLAREVAGLALERRAATLLRLLHLFGAGEPPDPMSFDLCHALVDFAVRSLHDSPETPAPFARLGPRGLIDLLDEPEANRHAYSYFLGRYRPHFAESLGLPYDVYAACGMSATPARRRDILRGRLARFDELRKSVLVRHPRLAALAFDASEPPGRRMAECDAYVEEMDQAQFSNASKDDIEFPRDAFDGLKNAWRPLLDAKGDMATSLQCILQIDSHALEVLRAYVTRGSWRHGTQFEQALGQILGPRESRTRALRQILLRVSPDKMQQYLAHEAGDTKALSTLLHAHTLLATALLTHR